MTDRRWELSPLDRRRFLQLVAGGAAGATLPWLTACGSNAAGRKAIVLGLDGLDPTIIRGLMEAGRAPNFKKLADLGSFQPLRTTMPALSPVAWSSFITGLTPGGHAIADFIARDPETYMPVFSIYENRAPDLTLKIGGIELPIKGGGPVNLRQGKPFWAYLTEQGIPAWVSKVPTNFPVDETASKAIAGMGTPDLIDSYGSFSYWTSDPFEHYPNISGGTVQYVDVNENIVRTQLLGPVNAVVASSATHQDPYADNLKIPLTVYLDPREEAVMLEIQGEALILNRNEYSPWVSVEFDLEPFGSAKGIVRFLVKQLRPQFQLYATPINIDPADQAAPVTHPESFGEEIARDIGPFWTKGLPCDTKAFDYRILSDEDYVKQAELILEERLALFRHQWSRFADGLFYFYVSSTDQDAHMLWRNMDSSHPKHDESDARFAGWIPYLYERMDEIVGEVLPAIDDRTLVLICSDHGFAQFGRQFHLNTWLRDNGYLTLVPGAEKKEETAITDVDWQQTLAFGIGFNGLYLNLKNRESQGIIEPAKASEVAGRLHRELEALIDPETGQHPVARVYRRDEMYVGEATAMMPELLVGYTPGYRNASSSVLGATGSATIDLNPWAWSGDHSMARDLVPGSLFSSRKVVRASPSILDLPVTLLEFFGIDKPEPMVGSSIFRS
jgi:predicted AlkP superfamily phosphohydrolase/phosphomutase